MSKKILFLILVGIFVLPLIVTAQAQPSGIAVLDKVLDNIGKVVIAIGTALIVVGFVVAGVMYLASAGNTEKMGTAKKALVASIIGAVIVTLAIAANGIVQILNQILGNP
ncbi:MAG: hypothetical protein HYT35_01225 [Candidatus Staskawiczbacteria bacterium]|nr:hypothetical protein [Candidatus Staskawiczbacteria bacterium]